MLIAGEVRDVWVEGIYRNSVPSAGFAVTLALLYKMMSKKIRL